MAPTKDQILATLSAIPAPDGRKLTESGTVSDIVVGADGKVFFSISVDAAAVKAWEPVRKQAEDAVKAMPGIVSAMIALTAERAGGAGGAARPAPARTSGQGPAQGHAHAPANARGGAQGQAQA